MGPEGDTCPVACTRAQTDQAWGLALLQWVQRVTPAHQPPTTGNKGYEKQALVLAAAPVAPLTAAAKCA